jgi:hypothetical protein
METTLHLHGLLLSPKQKSINSHKQSHLTKYDNIIIKYHALV